MLIHTCTYREISNFYDTSLPGEMLTVVVHRSCDYPAAFGLDLRLLPQEEGIQTWYCKPGQKPLAWDGIGPGAGGMTYYNFVAKWTYC